MVFWIYETMAPTRVISYIIIIIIIQHSRCDHSYLQELNGIIMSSSRFLCMVVENAPATSSDRDPIVTLL